MRASVIGFNRFDRTAGRDFACALEEILDLTSHITSAESANALFSGDQNVDAQGKLVTIEPKYLARQAFCSIPNYCRACMGSQG